MQIYKVGGYVRDTLLGLNPSDCDYVVVGSDCEEMNRLGYIQVGKAFPVFLHPISKEEYALARTEQKVADGHQGFKVNTSPTVTLEEDLLRRDLTINAIAQDDNNHLIDPYGGIADLRNGVLRHISPAFSEDPLRILRVARFAATFNFKVAPETMKLLQQMAATEDGKHISKERIFRELAIALEQPYAQRFFATLISSNNLPVFFPHLGQLADASVYNNFNALFTKAVNGRQRYSVIALFLARNDDAITGVTLNRDLKIYLKNTQLIYDTIVMNPTAEEILTTLRFTRALHKITAFKNVIANLKWVFKQQQHLHHAKLAELLLTISHALGRHKPSELILPDMNTHAIITSIHTWQIKVINHYLRNLKC